MYAYLLYLQLNLYTLMVELSVGKKRLLRCKIGFGPRLMVGSFILFLNGFDKLFDVDHPM